MNEHMNMNEHFVHRSTAVVRPLEATGITTSFITYGGRGQISHEDSATVAASLTVALVYFFKGNFLKWVSPNSACF